MTRRFLAVLWQSEQEPATASLALETAKGAGMKLACRLPGFILMTRQIEAFAVNGEACTGAAAILGDLHFRHGPGDACRGSPGDTERLNHVLGNGELAARCWGSFLALRRRGEDGCLEAYHSPFSSLSAYYAQTTGALLLASDARLLAPLVLERPRVHWSSLAVHLAYDNFAFRSTCLNGIRELRCGELLEWAPGSRANAHWIWNPWQHAAPANRLDDREAALEILEREIIRCANARLQAISLPLLDLSGGLDSSILAALASRYGSEVCAVNMFSQATEGDERHFARAVAEQLGMPLVEAEPQAEMVDIRLCASPHLPRPHARSFVQEIDRLTIAASPQSTAFLNGGGGDAVFCHLQSSGPAVDVLRARGAGVEFFRTVHQVAEAAQVSFWIALRKTLAKAARRGGGVKLTQDRTFLVTDVLAEPFLDELPWPEPPAGMPAGKMEHVRGIYSSCFNMHGFARSGSLKAVFPLLSQPLVETCLRIPSWMWLGQGHDRYLAREVAAKWLPANVVWRRSKGGLGQLQRDIYWLNRSVMREMLLEGELQKAGVVDRAALEAELHPRSDLTSNRFPRLLRLCDFEAWASHWA